MTDPDSAQLSDRGGETPAVEARLRELVIETPSWGYGDSGTRFGVFPQPGRPRTVFERVDDAAEVHRLTGTAGAVALHFPWDAVEDVRELAGHISAAGLRVGAELARDADALDQVLDGASADRRVGMADRAELVVGVLEQVRVHRAHAQAARLDVRAQRAVVVHRVPREVHRHRARRAGQPVHLGGILDALEHVARAPGLREDAEARPRVGVAPRRRLDHERAQPGLDRRDVHPPIGELGGEAAVGVGHGVSSRGDRLMRWSGGEGR